MSTSIEVNKKSVSELLATGTKNIFVIPEYQRPYAWGEDEVQTLFDDLWEFTAQKSNASEQSYFLGTIVSYKNENNEQEIIDGQQRITSLFLFLRAIYTKLQNQNPKTPETNNFIRKIEPILWKTNELTGEVDFTSTLLKSRVINASGNQVLNQILETGITDEANKDNYSVNYRKFLTLIEKASLEDPMRIYHFINDILNNAILLPIQANEMDTALTIFSTLNDRGLQLSDSDIFKSQIYKKLDTTKRPTFINDWKALVDNSESIDPNAGVNKLFYYYMFYLRALDKDNKTTTPGLRKYFMDKNRLFADDLMDNLAILNSFWNCILKNNVINESWSQNKNIKQVLDILMSYPNEFWKYPVNIYYLSHHNDNDFENNFEKFLKKLCAELLRKYLVIPTINSVKGDIMKLNSECVTNAHPKFEFNTVNLTEAELKKKIITDWHQSVIRMMLKMLAYDKQSDLLPDKWEIEHMFPHKYQQAYVSTHTKEEIEEKIEHLGNKLPFEKKLNIIAGNNYFSKKKVEYAQSKIEITKEISSITSDDWTIDDINTRDVRVSDSIVEIMNRWENEYDSLLNSNATPSNNATEEELKQIEDFRKRGLI